MATPGLVGLWMDADGAVHLARRQPGGEVVHSREAFQPFAWSRFPAALKDVAGNTLHGSGVFPYRWRFPDARTFWAAVRDRELGLDAIRPIEHQWLLAREERMFEGMTFPALRRCQLRIESRPAGGAEGTEVPERVVAIGVLAGTESEPRILHISEDSDAAERVLIKEFGQLLAELDPDVIEGHDIYNRDLALLAQRARRFRVKRDWGRFGAEAVIRKSRLRVAERWIDYVRCDLPGRTVFDTRLAVQIFDVSTRDMPDYNLAEAAAYFGLAPEDADEADLGEALRQVAGVADRLLPTYVAQAQSFPMLLQEVCLRGSAGKVDLLLLERYYHAGHSLPLGAEVATFAGGFTKSYGAGVFRHVLHFDVASLYPSLLLQIGRNPSNDTLGAFIPTLENLRTYRLEYKQRARDEIDPLMRQEYQARQTSFKILINSFYGYLGFPGARFADGELASEVTARGRELLQRLIAWFDEAGIPVLEADTDGIYVSAPDYYDDPDALLVRAREVLPPGIDLEFDGRFPAMFCYKAKNYALFDGAAITVRGSALRSRGTEPFLKELTHHLIAHLLGVEEQSPEAVFNRMVEAIAEGEMPVQRLAKSEFLSMSPAQYRARMEAGGKPRRASLEVATRLDPPPRMGERVRYYIRGGEKGRAADWQRAEPLETYDPIDRPYDPKYYLKKLKEWEKRYRPFFD